MNTVYGAFNRIKPFPVFMSLFDDDSDECKIAPRGRLAVKLLKAVIG